MAARMFYLFPWERSYNVMSISLAHFSRNNLFGDNVEVGHAMRFCQVACYWLGLHKHGLYEAGIGCNEKSLFKNFLVILRLIRIIGSKPGIIYLAPYTLYNMKGIY